MQFTAVQNARIVIMRWAPKLKAIDSLSLDLLTYFEKAV